MAKIVISTTKALKVGVYLWMIPDSFSNSHVLLQIKASISFVILRCVALHAVLNRKCILCGRSILSRFVCSRSLLYSFVLFARESLPTPLFTNASISSDETVLEGLGAL